MEKHELRAAASLAAVFSVRMLGLFMVYPVFAAFARHLAGATPYKIGVALGIYGLSQGVLQMPFGVLSDRIGRKVMIVLGLVVFAAGSAVAARAITIDGMIVGRLLQGAGAIGSVVLALVADLTAEKSRTKAMALVGMTIGFSFLVAIVTGPAVAGWVGVGGIFWLMAALALVGIAITLFVVPTAPPPHVQPDAETVPALIAASLRNPQLLRLDFGIFALHAMLTASFLVVPALLHDTLAVSPRDQWLVYLPVLLVSVAVMVPVIILAERRRRLKGAVVGAVAAMAVSQIMLAVGGSDTVCSARRTRGVLLRLQHHGGQPALARHQDRAARSHRHRDGNLFQLAIPRYFRRRCCRRLGTSGGRHDRGVPVRGRGRHCLAVGCRDHARPGPGV